jgi:hypothetical protein
MSLFIVWKLDLHVSVRVRVRVHVGMWGCDIWGWEMRDA